MLKNSSIQLRIIQCLLPLLFATVAIANDDKLRSTASQRLGAPVESAAQGTLGTTNESYLAALTSKSEEEITYLTLTLLKQASNATFKIESAPFYAGGRWGWLVFFKNGSFYLHGDGSCGSVCHSSTTYQFQLRKDEYQLIGIEESYVRASETGEYLDTSGKSINLLTNRVEYVFERCAATDNNPWDCKRKPKIVRKEFRFPNTTRWNLQQFSPDKFVEFMNTTKFLHGYIDEKLHFQTIDNK